MSIRKDKTSGIWQLDLRTPSGERIRRSTETTDWKAAQEYHDKLKASLWRQAKLGEVPGKSFEEAAVRFLRESEGQSDHDTKVRYIAYWRERFSARSIRSLTNSEIVEVLPTHRINLRKGATPLANATLNWYLATIHRMLSLCQEWGWLDAPPKLPKYKEAKVRIRWEPPEVITELIRCMSLSWMRDATLVAVSTGLRESELFGLTSAHIDLNQCNAWVEHGKAKSGHARPVPLNDDVCEVLDRRLRMGKRYVFTRGGNNKLISRHDYCFFKNACRVTGINDFRWHDLRHTWASWHAQLGTPLMVLKELGGWETLEMVMKYAHLAPSHLADHANTVKFWSGLSEPEKTPLAIAA
jgi:integrase